MLGSDRISALVSTWGILGDTDFSFLTVWRDGIHGYLYATRLLNWLNGAE